MYAIIKTGGKQYRVAEGDVIDVELLKSQPGENVEFSEVLFFHDGKAAKIGQPNVSGCTVTGELIEEALGPKIVSVKYKRRQNQRRKFGHRQHYHRVRITSIGGAKKATKKKAKKEEELEGEENGS